MSIELKSLDDLFSAMKDNDPRTLDHHGQWSSELPTFGGLEPDDTAGVWSWDEKRILTGTCGADLAMEDKP